MLDGILNFITSLANELVNADSPAMAGLILFINGGWILALLMIWPSAKKAWLDWRQQLYHIKERQFIMLAIDVPRDNEQSPLAVENIFASLHGTIPSKNNLYQQWIEGKTPDFFSMEIVSIEGYVQFLVRTQIEFRDLVESAFYAQYPDAEITEVEDYVHGPNGEFKNLRFPSEEWNMLGCEFVQPRHFAYPIRLFEEFEHSLSQEFKDPMSSLLETFNKIGPGEHLWLQFVVTPEHNYNWQPRAEAEAMKIAGKHVQVPSSRVEGFFNGVLEWMDNTAAGIFPFYPKTEVKDGSEELPSLMLHLTPTEKAQVEGIQKKANKYGFWCKVRYVYLARKNVYSKPRGLSAVMGAMKQFSSLNLNSLGPHKYTKTWSLYYLFVAQRLARRQNNLLRAYQGRGRSAGSNGVILNMEELANLYHFPTIYVKAPLVARTQAKRASAPIGLPAEGRAYYRHEPETAAPSAPSPVNLPAEEPPSKEQPAASRETAPSVPENLPFV